MASRMMAVDAHEKCAPFVHPASSVYNFRPALLNRCHQRQRFLRGVRFKCNRRILSCSSVSDTAAVVEKQFKATETPLRNVLKFYNTMSRKKEFFVPIDEGIVKFYSCGPTIYDFAHIGNFRAFLTYDVIKRWLLYCGFKVNHVMNLTDIDDKIIDRAKKLNCSMSELTDKFADAFFKDMDLLNIIPAQHYPRATQHIKDIEDTIESLEDKGFAYKQDGSTYFSVPAFSKYGRLGECRHGKVCGAILHSPSMADLQSWISGKRIFQAKKTTVSRTIEILHFGKLGREKTGMFSGNLDWEMAGQGGT